MNQDNLLDSRTLGQRSVSRLALGSVKFGRNQALKYSENFPLPSDAELRALLDTARSSGINFIDCAPAYGSAEARLGSLVGADDYWVISTKVGEIFDPESGTSRFDFSCSGILQSLENSRRQLSRDKLDMVLVHCSDDDLSELTDSPALDTLELARARGWLGLVGASVKSSAALDYAIEHCDAVMCVYSLGLPEALRTQTEISLQRARELNRCVVLKKALDSGQSSDTRAALRFAVANEAVTSVVVGTINIQHLLANASAINTRNEASQ